MFAHDHPEVQRRATPPRIREALNRALGLRETNPTLSAKLYRDAETLFEARKRYLLRTTARTAP